MNSFLNFLLYFTTSIVLLFVFIQAYVLITPHQNFLLIKSGNIPISIVLAGAMIGFVMPLVVLSLVGVGWLDFVIWSVIAGLVQLGLFWFLYKIFPIDFEKYGQENVSMHVDRAIIAQSIVHAISSFCVGIINAFSHIPF